MVIFVWMMANQEVSRLVADQFNITQNSMHGALSHCALGVVDQCAIFIKLSKGKLIIICTDH